MAKHDARIRRLKKALAAKEARLIELNASLSNATNDKSRASFRGKITACTKQIASFKNQILEFEALNAENQPRGI